MSELKTEINDIIQNYDSDDSLAEQQKRKRKASLITGDNPAIDPDDLNNSADPKASGSNNAVPDKLSIPQLTSKIESDDIYANKDVSLVFEGEQQVFYRGDYVTRIRLHGEPLLVGRRDVMAGHYPDIDLAMYWKQDRSISRRHMRIYRDANGSWYAEDICNNNATFINSLDNPINHERVELKPGDRILISNSIAIVFTVN